MTHARIGKKYPPGFSMDVDLPVGPGVTALYGPAGAGKTVLLEAIAGLVRPESGRVLLEDAILFDGASGVFVPPRKRRCGYVCRGGALFPHMTLKANVMFAASARPRLERHRHTTEILEKLGLTALAERRPNALKPDERVRGALARALVAEPRLLLVDECGLDEALLRQVQTAARCPIVMVTADLDLCCAVASELAILSAGRILQRGAPAQVVDRPESAEVARLVGIPNLFPATILSLDPGQNSSRLELEHFALAGPYIRGHFRGDRVSVAIHPASVKVHGEGESRADLIRVQLLSASQRRRSVRLQFSNGIFADIPHEEFARQKDNKNWRVEFPPEALRVL